MRVNWRSRGTRKVANGAWRRSLKLARTAGSPVGAMWNRPCKLRHDWDQVGCRQYEMNARHDLALQANLSGVVAVCGLIILVLNVARRVVLGGSRSGAAFDTSSCTILPIHKHVQTRRCARIYVAFEYMYVNICP